MVAHAYKPSTWETEDQKSRIRKTERERNTHTDNNKTKFKTGLGYII